jgi:hypothetical protein
MYQYYMYKSIITIACLIILLYLVFSPFSIKHREGVVTQTGPSDIQIKAGDPVASDKKYYTYFSPRESKIEQIMSIMDRLKSIMPIRFSKGNISYDRIDEAEVWFSGEIPYVFINIKLPYPLAGDQGLTGDRGEVGEKGKKGPAGDKGPTGYTGSALSSWIFQG